MKAFYYIAVLLVVCILAQDSSAQTRTRRTAAESNNNTGLPELSVRAKAKNDSQGVNTNNVAWLRVLYREIDLKKEANTPLYYPTEPIGDRMNLFTMIFKLMGEGKLTAYAYIDGRESFTEQHKVDFEELLKTHHIIHKKTGSGATASFVIDASDIPSNEVLAYMIKEAYFFNQATGTFGSEVLAICPMLVREGDFGENLRFPLFWVPYENIRPYISRSLIMTSNYNNALTYTTDDFFQMKMYKGDIIKTTNLMNQTLVQQFPDSTQLKHAQDSIEKQLKTFESRLWLPKDTAQIAVDTKSKKASGEKADNANTKSSVKSSRSNTNTKSSAPKSTKTEKASSTPSKSVRRR